MPIPSQFPQAVATARGSALQTLALQAGQVIEAKVLGPAPGGGTQVEIAGQRLNLLMPALLAAGTTVKLEVQQAGSQLRLAMQLPTAPQSAIQSAPLASAMVPAPTALPTPSPQVPLAVQVVVATPQPTQAGPPAAPTAPGVAPIPVASNPAQPATLPSSPVGAAITTVPGAFPQAAATPAPAGPPPSVPTPATTGAPPQAPGQPAPAAPATPAPLPSTAPQSSPSAASPPVTQVASTPQLAAATIIVAPTPSPAMPLAPGQVAPGAQPAPTGAPVVAAAPATAAPPTAPSPVPSTPSTPVSASVLTAPLAAYAKAPPATQPSQPVPGAAPPAAVPVSLPSTPQAAITQMVQAALPRQDSIGALTAVLSAVFGKVALPEPVLKAVRQVLSGQTQIDTGKIDGATLQRAVLNSGLFQESRIATGQSTPAAGDMKTALLSLRSALGAWLGDQAPVQQVNRPPPPIRGAAPRVFQADAPQLAAATPREAGHKMLDHTEAALSRLRLHQAASLPDPVDPRRADWSVDLPVIIGTHQTTLGIQIHREPEESGQPAAERGWSLRFALNLPEAGEVGAQVSLRGAATGVMLWSADPETAEALRQGVDELRQDLAAAGLRPGAVIVRQGEPAPTTPTAQSGHLLDTSQ